MNATQRLEESIENLVDGHGLTAVVEAIATVCSAKAEHIRSSYQDEPLAKRWEEAGFSLVKHASHPNHNHGITFPS